MRCHPQGVARILIGPTPNDPASFLFQPFAVLLLSAVNAYLLTATRRAVLAVVLEAGHSRIPVRDVTLVDGGGLLPSPEPEPGEELEPPEEES